MENHNIICLDNYISDENLPSFCKRVVHYSDLVDLSQIIQELDLVISVDHLAVHLAGSMNIDTILMLSCVPNWRWDMNFRDNTVWYKSVKLLRQQIPGDWSSVTKRLSEHLAGLNNG